MGASAETSLDMDTLTIQSMCSHIFPHLPQALPHSGPTLMRAEWPATGCSVDPAALDQYEALKQLVRGVRNARLEYGLEQARKLAAVLVVSDPAVQTALQSELPAVCLLAKLDATKVRVLRLQFLL